MIIIKIIILYFIKIRHTDDFPSTGTCLVLFNCLWSAVAERYNARLSIERSQFESPHAAVLKLGQFRSLHDVPLHSAI